MRGLIGLLRALLFTPSEVGTDLTEHKSLNHVKASPGCFTKSTPNEQWKMRTMNDGSIDGGLITYGPHGLRCLNAWLTERGTVSGHGLIGGSVPLWRQALRAHIYSSHTQCDSSLPVAFGSRGKAISSFSITMFACILP